MTQPPVTRDFLLYVLVLCEDALALDGSARANVIRAELALVWERERAESQAIATPITDAYMADLVLGERYCAPDGGGE